MAAVLQTSQMVIGRTYDAIYEEWESTDWREVEERRKAALFTSDLLDLPTEEDVAEYGKAALLTWSVLLDAAKLLFESPEMYEFSKSMTLSEGVSQSFRRIVQGKETPRFTIDMIDANEVASVRDLVQTISNTLWQKYVPIDLVLAHKPFSEDVADRVGDLGMRWMRDYITCYLCDFTGKWTPQKSCALGRPHDWEEEAPNWKTTVKENEFFALALGSISTMLLFDVVRYAGSLDYSNADMALEVKILGYDLVAYMAYIYKKLNGVHS